MTRFEVLVLKALAGLIWTRWGVYTLAYDTGEEIENVLVSEGQMEETEKNRRVRRLK